MRRLILLFMMVVGVLTAPVVQAADMSKQHATKPVRLWETKPGLSVPESVLYDPAGQTLYVSNINGKSTEKNGQGFISKLSVDGQIQNLKWAVGLNAPKGSVIYKNSFLVSDIDRLVEIDMKNGQILAVYPAPGALFLNDVVADGDGHIYVSDMDKDQSAIWRLSGKTFAVWLKSPEIQSPNGLHMTKNKLMVGNSGDGKIKSIGLADRKIVAVATVGSGIDGLRPDGKGNYIVSDWAGKTSRVSPTGALKVLMDTTAAKINSADLEYVIDKKLLLIPTFFHNTVAAYQL